MLGKIASLGQAFIAGINGMAALVFFLGAAALLAFIGGRILEIVTRNVLGWHWPASNWMVVCLTVFLVFYGLEVATPALFNTLWLAIKGALYGALASGAVAWFYRLPWQTVALWGGIGFFLVCMFVALLQQRPARPSPVYDPFGSGVDNPDVERLRNEGLL